VEFQGIILQNVIEISLFSPLFHSFLVIPFPDALFCLFSPCTGNEVNLARIAVCYCLRGQGVSVCKIQK